MGTPLWTIFVVIVGCVIGAFGAVFFKKGSARLVFSIKVIKNYDLLVGFLLYGISTIFLIIALKFGNLSVLYPFVATTYVWIALFSIKYLNEKMNLYKWLGILFILTGVSLIGVGA